MPPARTTGSMPGLAATADGSALKPGPGPGSLMAQANTTTTAAAAHAATGPPALSAAQAADVAWAFTAARHRAPRLFAALAAVICAEELAANAAAAGGGSLMQHDGPSSISEAGRRTTGRLGRNNSVNTRRSEHATLQSAISGVASQSLGAPMGLPLSDVVNVLWAYGSWGFYHPQLVEMLAQRVASGLASRTEALSMSDAARAAWALATLRHYDERLLWRVLPCIFGDATMGAAVPGVSGGGGDGDSDSHASVRSGLTPRTAVTLLWVLGTLPPAPDGKVATSGLHVQRAMLAVSRLMRAVIDACVTCGNTARVSPGAAAGECIGSNDSGSTNSNKRWIAAAQLLSEAQLLRSFWAAASLLDAGLASPAATAALVHAVCAALRDASGSASAAAAAGVGASTSGVLSSGSGSGGHSIGAVGGFKLQPELAESLLHADVVLAASAEVCRELQRLDDGSSSGGGHVAAGVPGAAVCTQNEASRRKQGPSTGVDVSLGSGRLDKGVKGGLQLLDLSHVQPAAVVGGAGTGTAGLSVLRRLVPAWYEAARAVVSEQRARADAKGVMGAGGGGAKTSVVASSWVGSTASAAQRSSRDLWRLELEQAVEPVLAAFPDRLRVVPVGQVAPLEEGLILPAIDLAVLVSSSERGVGKQQARMDGAAMEVVAVVLEQRECHTRSMPYAHVGGTRLAQRALRLGTGCRVVGVPWFEWQMLALGGGGGEEDHTAYMWAKLTGLP